MAQHTTWPLPLDEYEDGEIEFSEDEVQKDGPVPGRYLRIRDDLAVAIDPNERLPLFLIDSHEAREKSWASPLSSPGEEAAVVDHVRRQVQQSVEIERREGAVPLGPTFTSTHYTPNGPGVLGICVLALPAS